MKKLRPGASKPTQVEDVSNKPKPAEEILDEQIRTALEQHQRRGWRLFVSSFSAGMEVGFSLFLMGIVYTLFHGELKEPFVHVLLSFSYALGFIFVVIGRSELFTEHTTLAVIPVLSGRKNLRSLMKVWGVIYSGNLLGGYLFSFIFTNVGPAMEIISHEAFFYLAHNMIKFNWLLILGSSILAGWLMGLLSWLVTSAQETISRIFIVSAITTVIGLGGLHHSIVGSIEVFAGMITHEEITVADYLNFQVWTTLGNIIGGVVFVAIVKFGTVDNK